MKKLLCFTLCFVLVFFCVNTVVHADFFDSVTSVSALRAGGGGSSGGGGGGGGSSGGSSSGSSYSGGSGSSIQGPSLLKMITASIALAITSICSSIKFYFLLTKRSRKSKALIRQMQKSDNAWKFKSILEDVETGFYAIQNAWSELDMTPASQHMSDKLFEIFQNRLYNIKSRGEQNILKDIKLLKALPVSVYDSADNDNDYVWFYIRARMIDYTIDQATHTKLSGNTSPESFVEYWQFVRKNDNWVLNKILQKNEQDKIPFTE